MLSQISYFSHFRLSTVKYPETTFDGSLQKIHVRWLIIAITRIFNPNISIGISPKTECWCALLHWSLNNCKISKWTNNFLTVNLSWIMTHLMGDFEKQNESYKIFQTSKWNDKIQCLQQPYIWTDIMNSGLKSLKPWKSKVMVSFLKMLIMWKCSG